MSAQVEVFLDLGGGCFVVGRVVDYVGRAPVREHAVVCRDYLWPESADWARAWYDSQFGAQGQGGAQQ